MGWTLIQYHWFRMGSLTRKEAFIHIRQAELSHIFQEAAGLCLLRHAQRARPGCDRLGMFFLILYWNEMQMTPGAHFVSLLLEGPNITQPSLKQEQHKWLRKRKRKASNFPQEPGFGLGYIPIHLFSVTQTVSDITCQGLKGLWNFHFLSAKWRRSTFGPFPLRQLEQEETQNPNSVSRGERLGMMHPFN